MPRACAGRRLGAMNPSAFYDQELDEVAARLRTNREALKAEVLPLIAKACKEGALWAIEEAYALEQQGDVPAQARVKLMAMLE